jgi:hypothetical protein
MVQLSATSCSCIAILWVSLLSFAVITLCVAPQRVFTVTVVYFVMSQPGNFWMHSRSAITNSTKRTTCSLVGRLHRNTQRDIT